MKNSLLFTRNMVALSLFILLSLGLSGCAHFGQVVSIDKQILFADNKNNQGTFKSGELTVDYNYRLRGENMILTGNVTYDRSVDYLDVRVLFLDRERSIVRQKIVYYSGYRVSRSWENDRSFQQTLKVPADAVGISFSYSAQLRSSHK